MKKFLLITTSILSFALCESVRACPSGQTQDPTTGHCILTGTSCGGKCTYIFDSETHDAIITKNPGVAENEEVILPENMYNSVIPWVNGGSSSGQMYIKNLTIGEGITGADTWAFASYANRTTGTQNGTLTLPSTFKSTTGLGTYGTPFWNLSFGTIDASALKDTELDIHSGAIKKLIVDQNSNTKFKIVGATNYDYYPANVNISCRGALEKCNAMISVYNTSRTSVTTSYYAGDDGNGHWEEWSDNGKAIYSDSSKTKLLGKYAFDGTQTGSYKYDGAGNLVQAYENGKMVYGKKIYTPAEAAAATRDGNDNVVSITW